MQRINFDSEWRFFLGDPAGTRRGRIDDSSWQVVDLPHDWSIGLPRRPDNPSSYSGGYFEMGRGWYRKGLDVPQDWQGKRVYILFEGVYMNAEVWLNEDYLGRHPYGYTSFFYDLSPFLKYGEQNKIVVRVDNSHQLNSRWYSGSGIYRHVWLFVADPVHIDLWGVYVTTPEVSRQSAAVQVETRVMNEGASSVSAVLNTRIVSSDGSVVAGGEVLQKLPAGEQGVFRQLLNVTDPRLWSPDTPDLYHLESEVSLAGESVDECETPFGIRSLRFNPETGFTMNGVALKLKGGCVHHDNGILGSASYDRAEERKVELHKASGYNAIRCAHNPPSPAFLDACDRLGMMVIDETFDCWREGKNYGDYHLSFDDWWQRDTDSMLLRDRNHPSIILWSIGNEVIERDGRSGGAEIARRLAERVHAVDPTRPITSAINGVWGESRSWEETDAVFAALDVGGYNYQLRQYRSDHERHPERMIVGTESFPMEAFDNWATIDELPYVLGDFVWTSLDYLGESGIGRVHYDGDNANFLGMYPWHQANCGDIDLCGFKRPQSFYRDILWRRGAPVYIGVQTPPPDGKTPTITRWGWPDVQPSWTWPGYEGKPLKIEVYSSCQQVELFLNGRSIGKQSTGKAERYQAAFEVAYEPGELKAVGLNEDKAVTETLLHTAASPAALRLRPDRARLPGAQTDLSYVTVELLDAEGRVHPCADRPVYFTVQGAGSIAAVGNADPVSSEPYRGNWRSTYHGRCLVVVKTTGQAGAVILRAQADGLAPTEVTLQVG